MAKATRSKPAKGKAKKATAPAKPSRALAPLPSRRAAYGATIVAALGRQSEARYGRGFGEKNLRAWFSCRGLPGPGDCRVVYESEVEREFAKKLDERDDIKLFVKLPDWFEIDTPVQLASSSSFS